MLVKLQKGKYLYYPLIARTQGFCEHLTLPNSYAGLTLSLLLPNARLLTVSKEDIQACMAQFHKLDHDGAGMLTNNDVVISNALR